MTFTISVRRRYHYATRTPLQIVLCSSALLDAQFGETRAKNKKDSRLSERC